jgi:ABC-type uncharacterized transport system auxiliary subunit
MTEEQRTNMNAWIKALESGNYRQGTGLLRQIMNDNAPSYCCLGVLCEINGLPRATESDRIYVYPNSYTSAVNTSHDWFTQTTGLDGDVQFALASANDKNNNFREVVAQLRLYLEHYAR